jgi:hypothetical protein
MITDGATAPASRAAMAGSAIEIEVAGMIVRVRGRVADALVEVLAAVKRGAFHRVEGTLGWCDMGKPL